VVTGAAGVVDVPVVVAGLAAVGVWVEVEDADPQALTTNASTTAGMRNGFMLSPSPPVIGLCMRTP
jgi:hypothetical protein